MPSTHYTLSRFKTTEGSPWLNEATVHASIPRKISLQLTFITKIAYALKDNLLCYSGQATGHKNGHILCCQKCRFHPKIDHALHRDDAVFMEYQ